MDVGIECDSAVIFRKQSTTKERNGASLWRISGRQSPRHEPWLGVLEESSLGRME